MKDQHEMARELSYPARKAIERGKSFWRQVGEHALVALFIGGCIVAAAWMAGKL